MLRIVSFTIGVSTSVLPLLALVGFLGFASDSVPLATGDWVEHGFTAGQRDELRAVFQAGVDRKIVPGGSLLLIHRGEVIFREAFGLADIESGRRFTTDALCAIASVTKPHTATVLVMLAEQGKLSLDEPVDKYLPEFANVKVRDRGPASSRPTVRQLLSHKAGFPGGAERRGSDYTLNVLGDLADAVADLARKELAAEPGSVHAYSSLGYFVAGRVAEVVSGKPFDELMREMLLEPIGAQDATFRPSASARRRVPTAYNRAEGGFTLLEDRQYGSCPRPGGGLYSTLDDIGRFLLLHRNRGLVNGHRIVSARALAKMYVPEPGTPGEGYGLGLNILEKGPDGTGRRIRHTGGSGTLAWIDFDIDLIVVQLTQVPQQQTTQFRRRVMAKIGEIFSRP